jgi:uncharacterized protein involved in exopolysaccharide biosynthesis
MQKSEVSLIYLLTTVFNYKNTLIKLIISFTTVFLILSLIWPKSYKSTVHFLPPPSESFGISGIIGSLLPSTPKTSKLKTEAILIILNSRTIKEKAIRKFQLNKVYGSDIIERLLKDVTANMEINEIREGGFGFNPIVSIEFSFIDNDPHRAEKITEFFVESLDSTIKNINYQRLFSSFSAVEDRFEKNKVELENAKTQLKLFQQTNGILELESQLQATISQIANLKSEIIQLEIRIDILSSSFSNESNEMIQLMQRKEKLVEKYNELTFTSNESDKDPLFRPLLEMPELVNQYSELVLEVTIQSEVYKFLYPQYEQIKQQIESTPLGIQIIDEAKLPTYKHSPKRIVIVLIGLFLSIFVGILFIFYQETKKKLAENHIEEYEKWRILALNIKKMILFWR